MARNAVQAFTLLDLALENKYIPNAAARDKRAGLERTMTASERRETPAVRRELEARFEAERKTAVDRRRGGGGVDMAGRVSLQIRVSTIKARNARQRVRLRLFQLGAVCLLQLPARIASSFG